MRSTNGYSTRPACVAWATVVSHLLYGHGRHSATQQIRQRLSTACPASAKVAANRPEPAAFHIGLGVERNCPTSHFSLGSATSRGNRPKRVCSSANVLARPSSSRAVETIHISSDDHCPKRRNRSPSS